MNGFREHLWTSIRLNFRNRQAIVFGYVVPVFFLIAFGSFYNTRPPLVQEIGQVLTITVLGGACFGMPIAFVSERERGVWRRYRLTPLGTGWFVLSVLLSRYLLVLVGAAMQVGLAMWWYKMPAPAHPWVLFAAFTCASFAFLGIGLVISMVANGMGAVQALGQSVFLPMIIVGGVGVSLRLLPKWCRHVAAFLPGKYAVEVMRDAVDPRFAPKVWWFAYAALLLIGTAGVLAGVKLFRWENSQKMSRGAMGWAVLAVAVWLVVGVAAEWMNLI